MYTFLLFYLFIIVKATIAGICLQKQKPDQIRLAIASKNSVNVGWHSYACPFSTKNPNPTPRVKYGLSPAALTSNSTNGKSSTYNTKNIFTRTSWFYGVELQDLQPRTLYYYQIVAMNNGLASDIFSFTSPPALGDRSQPVKIAAYGDMGVDGLLGSLINGVCLFERAVIALQKMLPSIDFVLHHGDICYADDTPLLVLGKTYDQAMDYCQMAMMNITSKRYYMTAVGNHEINCTQIPFLRDACPKNYRNQFPYSNRFNMPSKQSGGYLNAWYSFNYGFVHVVSLSCESDFPNAPSGNLLDTKTQVNWLKNDLAAVNRSITPWIIVQCHRPWKGSIAIEGLSDGKFINCPQCKAAFEAILIKYKVDIYFAGHVHWYERICPNGGKKTADYINPNGPIYITNGAIGNPEGNDHVFKRSSDSCRIITDPGFGVLTLVNARQATFSFYRTSDLVELDRINIIKAR
ncbi:unnamed protein product [Rotaria sordida]|uniref:Purple acid phosphatase n=1 Tax=Rotaria sordida TaxID=392033 RepID=A0A815Y8Q2_9BILA|nr:unnamed protein product [Rotaria sordida]